LRKEFGNSILAQRVLAKVTDPQKNYVINGIRNPAEIAELKNFPSFFLVAIDSPQQLRFQRMIQRARVSDPKTFYDFMKADNIDQGQNQDESGQQVRECMKLADYFLMNEFSLERLTDKIGFLIQQISNKDAMARSGASVF